MGGPFPPQAGIPLPGRQCAAQGSGSQWPARHHHEGIAMWADGVEPSRGCHRARQLRVPKKNQLNVHAMLRANHS